MVFQSEVETKDGLKIEVRKGALVLRPYLLRAYRLQDLVNCIPSVTSTRRLTSADQRVERRAQEAAAHRVKSLSIDTAGEAPPVTSSP